jgi:HD-GYP domain-containing protein (c-di-GMP phosphodiesterase class II)
MNDNTQPHTMSEVKLNARTGVAGFGGGVRTITGQVKSADGSPWELFVESPSFSSLTPLEEDGSTLRPDDGVLQSFTTGQAESVLTPFFKRLHQVLTFGYKRRYKEAMDLAEASMQHPSFTEAERMRFQLEYEWQRYQSGSEEVGNQVLRNFEDIEYSLNGTLPKRSTDALKACLYLYKGCILYAKTQVGVAMRQFRQGLNCAAQDSPVIKARTFDAMAQYYVQIGNFSHALHLMNEALSLKSKTPFRHEVGLTYQALGQTCLMIENYTDAQRHIERALAIAIEMKDHWRETELMNDLIKIAIINKQLVKALHLTNECLQRCQAQKLRNAYGTALLYRAYIHFLNEEWNEATDLLEKQILPVFGDFTNDKGYGVAYRLMGAVLSAKGNKRKALETVNEAIVIFKRQKRHDELAKTYFEQAQIYSAIAQTGLAIQSLSLALGVAQRYNLMFLLRSIEDELYRLAPEQWERMTDNRMKHANGMGNSFEAFGVEHLALNDLEEPRLEASDSSGSQEEEGGLANGLSRTNQNALMSLLRLGQAISAERELDNILHLVREETVKALNAERCTVFVYDKERDELWSKVASGLEGTKTLRIPADKGLAGHVLKVGEALNIADVYNDTRFNREVDRKTGYKTRNLLCIPILNRDNESIGVVQVLNKATGAFNKADEDLLRAIAATTGITLENAIMAQEQKRSFESFVITLSSAIDARDPITAGHSERVSDFSLIIGEEMRMPTPQMEALRFSALLHDIGKIGIREDVLTKEGRLTIAEYKHIQKHALYTYEILQNIHFTDHLKDVPAIAAAHHERVDGTGYYKGLKGEEIPLSSRIIALSDVFDAITSLRHYRSRMPFDKVLKIIRKDAGSHFDNDCVDMFFRVPLYRIAQVLVKERSVKKVREVAPLVNNLDKSISLHEFEALLGKPNRSKQEEEIDRFFSAVYYVLPNKDQDNF